MIPRHKSGTCQKTFLERGRLVFALKKSLHPGFTFLELLVVITIVAILTHVLVFVARTIRDDTTQTATADDQGQWAPANHNANNYWSYFSYVQARFA